MNNLIKIYIDTLTLDKVKDFASQNQIQLSEEEFEKVYAIIKQNGRSLISNESALMQEVENTVNKEAFYKIQTLISKYKEKYRNYL